jgi:hypothetical protein
VSALAMAAQAPAVTPPASPNQTIIVTGTKTNGKTVDRYVNAITVPVEGQLAAFHQPICPASVGLPKAYNRVVEARLRRVATDVGLKVAGARCDPNLVLIVADQSANLIERLRKVRPDIFAGIDYSKVADVMRTQGPVRTWQAILPYGADGRPLERVSLIDFGDGPRPMGDDSFVLQGTSDMASRISHTVRRDLVAAFVVLDLRAINGLTLTQIADYAAMRTLANTRPPSRGASRTILGLFDDSTDRMSLAGLTRWDIAYLRSLYQANASLSASSQKSDDSRRDPARPGATGEGVGYRSANLSVARMRPSRIPGSL